MGTLSALVADASLLFTVVLLIVFPVVALLLFFPLFLLAVLGVLTEVADRSVTQHDPPTKPMSWRGVSNG
jgi:predicted membrane metal-binding protein